MNHLGGPDIFVVIRAQSNPVERAHAPTPFEKSLDIFHTIDTIIFTSNKMQETITPAPSVRDKPLHRKLFNEIFMNFPNRIL